MVSSMPEDRCGISSNKTVWQALPEAFYFNYGKMSKASTPGPHDEFLKSTCQMLQLQAYLGGKMPAFYYSIESNHDAQNAILRDSLHDSCQPRVPRRSCRIPYSTEPLDISSKNINCCLVYASYFGYR